MTERENAEQAMARMGRFGKLFLDCSGCERGPMGEPSGMTPVEWATRMDPIQDADGTWWRPVQEQALQELLKKVSELERVLDAAIRDIRAACIDEAGPCSLCRYNGVDHCTHPDGPVCDDNKVVNWKWKGLDRDSQQLSGKTEGERKMNLSDTVQMMNSEDYRERFKAEYWQTRIRYEKLHRMTVQYEAGTLDFEPDCELSLLLEQKKYMGLYLNRLEVRAEVERIALEAVDGATC